MWAKWMYNPCWLGASVIGGEFENVALMWGKCLQNPCFLGGPSIGDETKVWAKWPDNPWCPGGSQIREETKTWPTCDPRASMGFPHQRGKKKCGQHVGIVAT